MDTFEDIDLETQWPPVYGRCIQLPRHTMLWRSYNTDYPSIAQRPMFYGTLKIAKGYETLPKYRLGLFTNEKALDLLDYRFLKVLLTDFFQKKISSSFNDIKAMVYTNFAFGLTSLDNQIRIAERMYLDPSKRAHIDALKHSLDKDSFIEKKGFRIAETNNDGVVMRLLQFILDGIADGFIAPRQLSPYHIEKEGQMHPEIIIFNPFKSRITQLESIPKSIHQESIYNIVTKYSCFISIDKYVDTEFPPNPEMSGGGEQIHPLEKFYTKVKLKNKQCLKLIRFATKVGKIWQDAGCIREYVAPHPKITIAPWPDDSESC